MKNKFLIFKIIGVVGIIIAIYGIVLVFTGFGNFENNNFMIGSFVFPFGLMIGFIFLMRGFKPEISRMQIETMKHIQEENKQILTDIANNNADITENAITQTTRAIKDGFNDTMYCKHCGEKIDSNSKFCKVCGKEQ